MCHILIFVFNKKKYFYIFLTFFLAFFSTLNELALKNWVMNMLVNPRSILSGLFLRNALDALPPVYAWIQTPQPLGLSFETNKKTCPSLAPSGDTTIEDREKGLEEPTWIRGNYIKETVHLD